jgi:MFS family permease
VVGERLLVQGEGAVSAQEPANRFPLAVVIGVVLGLWTGLLGRWAANSVAGRRALGVWITAWGGGLGLVGLILTASWFLTDHVFWRWNENVFHANPVLLAAPLLAIPLLRGREPSPRLRALFRWVRWVALGAAALKLLPGIFIQENWGIVAALVPTHMMLARTFPLNDDSSA